MSLCIYGELCALNIGVLSFLASEGSCVEVFALLSPNMAVETTNSTAANISNSLSQKGDEIHEILQPTKFNFDSLASVIWMESVTFQRQYIQLMTMDLLYLSRSECIFFLFFLLLLFSMLLIRIVAHKMIPSEAHQSYAICFQRSVNMRYTLVK